MSWLKLFITLILFTIFRQGAACDLCNTQSLASSCGMLGLCERSQLLLVQQMMLVYSSWAYYFLSLTTQREIPKATILINRFPQYSVTFALEHMQHGMQWWKSRSKSFCLLEQCRFIQHYFYWSICISTLESKDLSFDMLDLSLKIKHPN